MNFKALQIIRDLFPLTRIPLLAFALAGLLPFFVGCSGSSAYDSEILNVSYDPTRELYQEINAVFQEDYLAKHGKSVKVNQSHGGGGAQTRAVIDGLQADVVTLALAGDINALVKKDLLDKNWEKRLDNYSCPYNSTIVFLVRAGNPKKIKNWDDLIRPDVKVITPNPKTSGGARWNFLAAWGFITIHQKKPETDAFEYMTRLFANVPKLDIGARGATETFVRRRLGDVFLAWENEALLAQKEVPEQKLEIVYPPVTILAEPPVAVVDQVVAKRDSRVLAEAYVQFLYTEPAQEIIARQGYRPTHPAVRKKFADAFPAMETFTIRDVAGSWALAQKKFFGDDGVFDKIYELQNAN